MPDAADTLENDRGLIAQYDDDDVGPPRVGMSLSNSSVETPAWLIEASATAADDDGSLASLENPTTIWPNWGRTRPFTETEKQRGRSY